MSAFTTIARTVSFFKNSRSPARAYIIPLNILKNDERMDDQIRSFQYFPSSIKDSHSTSYQTKVIPGLSHPLYQWTTGGARSISFEAIFTRDRAYTSSEKRSIESLNVNTGFSVTAGFSNNKDLRNVDIPSAIAWLRSFTLPSYYSNSEKKRAGKMERPYPPPKLILGLPGTRINFGVNEGATADEMFCIMTSCEVDYDGFFSDGSPRMAKVGLSFAEIIQVGGRITPHDGSDRREYGMAGYTYGKR